MEFVFREVEAIASFVVAQITGNWWILALSIPLVVLGRRSGVADTLRKTVEQSHATSILLATLFGALSPLCSCTVVPVILGLLSSGVPLAPVMSFWIASPSMDPEILLLSAATLGWPLAVARLVGTLAMSLAGGFLTHALQSRGVFGAHPVVAGPAAAPACATGVSTSLFNDIVHATRTVGTFVVVAFVLEALLVRYLPASAVLPLVGTGNRLAVAWAAVAGIPLYTGTIAAVGLAGGLIHQGMSTGAALAFLIAGPTTTIPALAAVLPLVNRRVFAIYVLVPFAFALLAGWGWNAAL